MDFVDTNVLFVYSLALFGGFEMQRKGGTSQKYDYWEEEGSTYTLRSIIMQNALVHIKLLYIFVHV